MADVRVESVNPCCCGLTLHQGTKYIAIFDIAMSAGSAIISAILTFALFFSSDDDNEPDLPDVDPSNSTTDSTINSNVPDVNSMMALKKSTLILFFFVATLISLMYAYIGKYLLDAARRRSIKDLNLWFNITFALMMGRIVFYGLAALLTTGWVFMPSYGIFGLLFTAYSLWVVHSYKRELILVESTNNPYESSFLKQFYSGDQL